MQLSSNFILCISLPIFRLVFPSQTVAELMHVVVSLVFFVFSSSTHSSLLFTRFAQSAVVVFVIFFSQIVVVVHYYLGERADNDATSSPLNETKKRKIDKDSYRFASLCDCVIHCI